MPLIFVSFSFICKSRSLKKEGGGERKAEKEKQVKTLKYKMFKFSKCCKNVTFFQMPLFRHVLLFSLFWSIQVTDWKTLLCNKVFRNPNSKPSSSSYIRQDLKKNLFMSSQNTWLYQLSSYWKFLCFRGTIIIHWITSRLRPHYEA